MRTPKVGRGNFPQPPTGDVKPGDEWYDWCVDVWEDANPDVELPKIFEWVRVFIERPKEEGEQNEG